MKVFWWQGGLHIDPENKEDADALTRLWNADRVPASSIRNGSGSTSVGEQAFDLVAVDSQILPRGIVS